MAGPCCVYLGVSDQADQNSIQQNLYMDKARPTNLKSLRLIITVSISILIIGLLFWTHFNGGVPSHHILQQKELPAISNWWGGILLPILSWILLGKIKNRIEQQPSPDRQQYRSKRMRIIALFCVGLIFGILLAVAFTNNYKPFLDNALYIILDS